MPASKMTICEVHKVIVKHVPDFDKRNEFLTDLLHVTGNSSFRTTLVDLWVYNAKDAAPIERERR